MSTVETSTKPARDGSAGQRSIVVVDLGKRSRKQIKRLRRGEGRLMSRVEETVDQLKADGEVDAKSEVVVMVVRERDERKGLFS